MTKTAKRTLLILAILAAMIVAAVLVIRSRYDVTIDLGTALNEDGDGRVVAAWGYDYDPEYSYISYRSTNAKPGDLVLTILWQTCGTEDDIVRRDDIILRHARP